MAKVQVFWVVSLNIASYFLAKLIEKIIAESPKLTQTFLQYVDINFYYMLFVTFLNIGILYFILRKNRRMYTRTIDQQKKFITAHENNIKLLKEQISIKNKKILEGAEKKSNKVATKKLPKVNWLTGKDVIKKHDISAIELYQYIKNGLDIYPKDFSTIMLGDQAQLLSEYDIGFEIDFDISNSSEMCDLLKDYHFKVCDIEKYIRANKST